MIVINRIDGGISMMTLINGADLTQALEKWKLANPGLYVSHSETNNAPTDRTFRAAWKASGGRVEVDMPLAREIHKARLRELRAPKIAALDVEYMRSLENGDAIMQGEIAAKKQALRDVTEDPGIAAATTPEELKAVLPAALK
jgi:hypothetical protein